MKKRREWYGRLIMEKKKNKAYFVTLTYNEENLPFDDNGNPTFCKRHIQLFLKRLRASYSKFGLKLRYFIVSEYGSNYLRPHYHAIIFCNGTTHEQMQHECEKSWKHGFVCVGSARNSGLNYCCKYVLFKSDILENRMRPFAMMSKKPPIGYSYFTPKMVQYICRRGSDFMIPIDGMRFSLSRVFVNYFLNDDDVIRRKLKLKKFINKRLEEWYKKHDEWMLYVNTHPGPVPLHPYDQFRQDMINKANKQKSKNLL